MHTDILKFKVAERENLETAKFVSEVGELDLIFLMRFGSHLYGTNTPESDLDVKGVYLPSVGDLLLEQTHNTLKGQTKKEEGRNTKDDIDVEIISFKQFMEHFVQGQTYAMDMIFAPPETYLIEETRHWQLVKFMRDQLLSKQIKPFIGYCLEQASKYGIKGSRISALKNIIEFLSKFPPHVKLKDLPELKQFITDIQKTQEGAHYEVVQLRAANSQMEEYLNVCKKKCPFNASVKTAIESYTRSLESYGDRAKQAELNQGVDWKALSHAVRVIGQAHELLSTGTITFPRPDAAKLLDIKQGKYTYKEVEKMIEEGIESMEIAYANSSLPEKPNDLLHKGFLLSVLGGKVYDAMKEAFSNTEGV